MTRVADFPQHSLLTSLIFETQDRMDKTQLQVVSGKKAPDYKGISRDSERLVSLEATHVRVSQYIRNNDIVEERLNTMESNVAEVFDIMTEFRKLLVNGLNNENAADLNLTSQAQQMLLQVAAQLNVDREGRFLFGGSRTNVEPVDLSGLPVTYTVPTNDGDSIGYYQGDSTQLSVQADDQFTMTYGVTADEPAFERAIRALDVVIKNGPTDRAALDHALSLVSTALDDLADVRTRIGVDRTAISDLKVKHEDFILSAEGTISDIENVDVTEALTILNNEEVNLQASFLTLSKLTGISLMNFLR
jgi:flagellar hook-associated protein 3 FlgL